MHAHGRDIPTDSSKMGKLAPGDFRDFNISRTSRAFRQIREIYQGAQSLWAPICQYRGFRHLDENSATPRRGSLYTDCLADLSPPSRNARDILIHSQIPKMYM